MCELFAAASKEYQNVNSYLKTFYSHSNNHPHGWGLACMDGSEVVIEKEPIQASKSIYLKERLSQPINVKYVLAHIRYATIGNVEYKNCHPYSKKDNFQRRWTLIHNGTIFSCPPLNKFVNSQTGDTDSERILLYIVNQINKAQNEKQSPLSAEERFAYLDKIVSDISKGNKLNLIIYDGEYMYVHTNHRNSLHVLEREDFTIFSTLPLSDEKWKPVKFTTLLAFKNGELVFEGTNHKNEFVDNEESIKYLYRIFSDL